MEDPYEKWLARNLTRHYRLFHDRTCRPLSRYLYIAKLSSFSPGRYSRSPICRLRIFQPLQKGRAVTEGWPPEPVRDRHPDLRQELFGVDRKSYDGRLVEGQACATELPGVPVQHCVAGDVCDIRASALQFEVQSSCGHIRQPDESKGSRTKFLLAATGVRAAPQSGPVWTCSQILDLQQLTSAGECPQFECCKAGMRVDVFVTLSEGTAADAHHLCCFCGRQAR